MTKQNCDFKGAANYLKHSLGIQTGSDISSSHLRLVHDHQNSDVTANYIKEQNAKEKEAKAKQVIVNKLYGNAKVIDSNCVAGRYLNEHRAIKCALGQDIKTTTIYHKETSNHLPALIAFARDREGKITSCQQILLDGDTGSKADIAAPKKSLGRISGSFVDTSSVTNASNINAVNSISSSNTVNKLHGRTSITIIAEGLETALSVKQALENDRGKADKDFKVLCSLGISNIKNYRPEELEKIIIAADNDGDTSITNRTIQNAKVELINKGAFVEVVRPDKIGDFNDMLKVDNHQAGNHGEKEIQKLLSRALTRHTAVTLKQYFSHKEDAAQLSEKERGNINYLQQFNISEEKIVNAYRNNPTEGRKALEKTVKPIAHAQIYVKDNMRVIDSANLYGAGIDGRDLTLALVGKNLQQMDKHLFGIREIHYFRYSLDELAHNKKNAKTPLEGLKALKAEQDFLAMHYENHAPDIHSKALLNAITNAYQNEQNNVFSKIEKLTTHIERTEIKSSDVTGIIKNSTDSHSALNALTKKYHGYVIHVIDRSLKDIHTGMQITVGNKPFTCRIKLLEHLLHQQRHNEFFPKDHIEHIHNELLHNQKQLSNSFHGPVL